MYKFGAGWSWYGLYWPIIHLILFVLIIFICRKNIYLYPTFPESKKSYLSLFVLISFTIYYFISFSEFFSVNQIPIEKKVELDFPLKNGKYIVVHGGGNEAANAHFSVIAQKYAMDILKLNKYGISAIGLMPESFEKYEIWDKEVYAPCSGEVISVQKLAQDQKILIESDSVNLAGNFVVIYCKNASILIAHLKKDSVSVNLGEFVEIGRAIGRVGNSGNTSEPHLHIHAVSGRVTDYEKLLFEAEGIPITFNNKFYVRNDTIDVN